MVLKRYQEGTEKVVQRYIVVLKVLKYTKGNERHWRF
jgi:hypothetical protein